MDGSNQDGRKNIEDYENELERLENETEKLHDALRRIKNWANAYPLECFPEPDMSKVAKVLKDNGLTLDAVSASNMRRVLKGVKGIVEEALRKIEPHKIEDVDEFVPY